MSERMTLVTQRELKQTAVKGLPIDTFDHESNSFIVYTVCACVEDEKVDAVDHAAEQRMAPIFHETQRERSGAIFCLSS